MTVKALKYTIIVLSLLTAFGANAQSQSANDDDDEILNIDQATESEYINMSGQVLTHCYLWVDVKAAAANLNLRNDSTNQIVASIQETCNSPAGYTVDMSSANKGYIMNGVNAVKYTITYDLIPGLFLSSTRTAWRSGPRFDDVTNTMRNFSVKLTALTSAVSGAYTDTITLTIKSNS